MEDIMISKFRPKTLDEVIGQPVIVRRLKKYVEAKQCMHMLFCGDPGIGKTSTAMAFLQDLYGESWRDNVLELNASDERGIDTIRNKVQDFARTLAISDDVPFKVVFLDEAEFLTPPAQATLRRVMEDYSRSNRFILSCNYVHKIISPIQDRCSIFRFGRLDWGNIYAGLSVICKGLKLDISDDAIKIIAKNGAKGSMRKALNILEDLYITRKDKTITDVHVDEIVGHTHRKNIGELMKHAKDQNFLEFNNILQVMKIVDKMSIIEIIHEMISYVEESKWPNLVKQRLYYLLAEVEWRCSQGADDWVQMRWLLSQIKDLKDVKEVEEDAKNTNGSNNISSAPGSDN